MNRPEPIDLPHEPHRLIDDLFICGWLVIVVAVVILTLAL